MSRVNQFEDYRFRQRAYLPNALFSHLFIGKYTQKFIVELGPGHFNLPKSLCLCKQRYLSFDSSPIITGLGWRFGFKCIQLDYSQSSIIPHLSSICPSDMIIIAKFSVNNLEAFAEAGDESMREPFRSFHELCNSGAILIATPWNGPTTLSDKDDYLYLKSLERLGSLGFHVKKIPAHISYLIGNSGQVLGYDFLSMNYVFTTYQKIFLSLGRIPSFILSKIFLLADKCISILSI